MKSSVALIIAIMACPMLRADVSVESGRTEFYLADIPINDEVCRLTIEIEQVGFLISSVADNYRLLRIRLENHADIPLRLSKQSDTFDLVMRGDEQLERVRASLNLRDADPAFWDTLEISLREVLVYPSSIPATRDLERGRSEVAYLYVFAPRDKVDALPEWFEYTIASLGTTVLIRPRQAAAR